MHNGSRDRRTGYVETEGERVYFEVTGEGPPVVLCHGLGGNHAIWWQQVHRLAERHFVVTWDVRGFGNSTMHDEAGVAAAARDLRALINYLGLTEAHLVGQSMGGFAALRACLDDSGGIASLVLSTTMAGARPGSFPNVEPGPDVSWRDRHPVITREFAESNADLVVLYNLISSLGARIAPPVMLASMQAEVYDNEDLRVLPMPVHLIAAEYDFFAPVDVMRATKQRFSRATLTVLPRAGHSAYYEVPDAWNRAVLDVIESGGTGIEAAVP
jgi:3-oxoadipate enol-lactonase